MCKALGNVQSACGKHTDVMGKDLGWKIKIVNAKQLNSG